MQSINFVMINSQNSVVLFEIHHFSIMLVKYDIIDNRLKYVNSTVNSK